MDNKEYKQGKDIGKCWDMDWDKDLCKDWDKDWDKELEKDCGINCDLGCDKTCDKGKQSIFAPTKAHVYAPTKAQVNAPTVAKTYAPTEATTYAPTKAPTYAPTKAPTYAPTKEKTYAPAYAPTKTHTFAPTYAPTFTFVLVKGVDHECIKPFLEKGTEAMSQTSADAFMELFNATLKKGGEYEFKELEKEESVGFEGSYETITNQVGEGLKESQDKGMDENAINEFMKAFDKNKK
jgi:hypothetical protein